MENETEFKFQPYHVTILFLGFLITAFSCYIIILGDPIWLLCWPIILGWVSIPNFLKLIKGIPAIALTDDYLIDNINELKIEWEDISEIFIQNTARGPGAIGIKLKQPEKYINTTLKRMAYKIRKLWSSADIVIYFPLISEKNGSVYPAIYTRWLEHNTT